MTQNQNLMNIFFSFLLIGITIYILEKFIGPLVWGSIIVITTYPLYRKIRLILGGRKTLSASLLTLTIGLILLLPLSWLIKLLLQESQLFINYIQLIDKEGGKAPEFLNNIPYFGSDLLNYWEAHMAKPGFLKHITTNIHLSISPASYYVKKVSFDIAARSVQLAFTVLCVFFLYRDGESLVKQINTAGKYCIGERWQKYSSRLPKALRSTVSGTLLVGIGVGILMGVCYFLVNFPAPTLFGFITAIASMVPFLVPIVFLIVALVLFFAGHVIGAFIVLIWGTLVMFVADHFVKPGLIGGSIELPFLAVLFSILGGVEAFGLLGLFLGPIVMVLFMTLWQETQQI